MEKGCPTKGIDKKTGTRFVEKMVTDIRHCRHVTHGDIVALNFVRQAVAFVFRAHRRQGLRSHVMEVLDPAAVEREARGQVRDGLRWFSPAKPLKMLRIFRTSLESFDQVRDETRRLKIMARYLGAEHLALSEEFVVSYRRGQGWDLLLCGLQEFVAGVDLDPWQPPDAVGPTLLASCRSLVDRIHAMMTEQGLIPDLAGAGNLLVTPAGTVKLVDINNSSRAGDSEAIALDDKGYPVWDKSVEALWRIERFWAGRHPDMARPWYRICRDPDRRAEVEALEARFKERVGDVKPEPLAEMPTLADSL